MNRWNEKYTKEVKSYNIIANNKNNFWAFFFDLSCEAQG